MHQRVELWKTKPDQIVEIGMSCTRFIQLTLGAIALKYATENQTPEELPGDKKKVAGVVSQQNRNIW